MKKTILTSLLTAFIAVHFVNAQEATFKEQIKKEIAFESNSKENTLILNNIFGSVKVEGYEGNQIQLVVDKKITADNTSDLETGKKELIIKVLERGNKIFIHPSAPYMEFDEEGLRYNWCNNYEEPAYKHQTDFTLKVPKNIKLDISTVNDGEVTVKNMRGDFIKANNVNGGISLINITGQTKVHCINGEVEITYADNPTNASKYYSLNGDINVTYQNALSADVSFKSMNGELFTDFEIEKQFNRTNKSSKNNKAKFKYESKPVVQIGKGGIDYDFETLNGNVFIKKI
ncbi:hypothetical protein MTsPCn9_24980 [Croceitalea sp. MTPC9]|uniref:DUF4097 family beta strand repeat-containing protein n=1 Tax=unclassified Croceitalea TaxID=2632280 RepID=UPI002B3ECA25|nr:hypothetical protein MTsPCn6_29550 [Croceitalea sp. MTPC6]GMN17560.1 hypothetical protein MTsPCn9_24980 [Croceitalea sp. MTPC9]